MSGFKPENEIKAGCLGTSDSFLFKIRSAAKVLGWIQTEKKNATSAVGFSNADYKLGILVSELGEDAAVAALLLLYYKQAMSYGIKKAELVEFLVRKTPSFEEDYASTTARSIVDLQRTKVRGLLAVKCQKDEEGRDIALFVGLYLSEELKSIFKAAGVETRHSYLVRASRLEHLLKSIPEGTLVNPKDLTPIILSNMQSSFNLPENPSKKGNEKPYTGTILPYGPGGKNATSDDFSIKVHKLRTLTDGSILINWDAFMSVRGLKIKEVVKSLGGRYDGQKKSWLLLKKSIVLLAPSLFQIENLNLEDFESASELSLEEENELAEIAIERECELVYVNCTLFPEKKGIASLSVRKKSSATDFLIKTVRSLGGDWDSIRKTMDISVSALPRLVRSLDKCDGLSLVKVLELSRKIEKDRTNALQTRLTELKNITNSIPDKTSTGKSLYSYQKEGIGFLLSSGSDSSIADSLGKRQFAKGALLCDDMGLGKSVMAITAADLKFKKEDRKLIVCPASLKLNWETEIRKWLGEDRTVTVISRQMEGIGNSEWTIINYDIIGRFKDSLLSSDFVLTIVDEAQLIRNDNTMRAEVLFGGDGVDSGLFDADAEVWCLTGTPLVNRPKDLFHLLRAVKHPLGNNLNSFLYQYEHPRHGAINIDELSEKISHFYLRREKEDVLDLPGKIKLVNELVMSEEDATAFRMVVPNAFKSTKYAIEAISLAKQKNALLKTKYTVEKIADILRTDSEAKVVVFSSFCDVLDSVKAAVESLWGEGSVVVFDGSMSELEKQQSVSSFQNDPTVKVFVGQIDCAGLGLTLTAGSDVLFNDYPWTPAQLSQAEDRVYRIGQKRKVRVHHLIAKGGFDEVVLRIIDRKKNVAERFEDGAVKNSLTQEEMVGELLEEIKGVLSSEEKSLNHNKLKNVKKFELTKKMRHAPALVEKQKVQTTERSTLIADTQAHEVLVSTTFPS